MEIYERVLNWSADSNDLLAIVEAPIRVILVADKLSVKNWVKCLHILKC
jgi:hypothetical protein